MIIVYKTNQRPAGWPKATCSRKFADLLLTYDLAYAWPTRWLTSGLEPL